MLSNCSNRLHGFIYASFLLLIFGKIPFSFALSTDQQQPIHITADQLVVDNQQDVAEYSGNVQVRQGSIKLNAQRLKLFRNQTGDLAKIEAYGQGSQRVYLEQQPKSNEDAVKGWADQVNYFADQQRAELINHAELHRNQDRYHGAYIEYFFKTQQVIANSNNSQKASDRVNILIVPKAK